MLAHVRFATAYLALSCMCCLTTAEPDYIVAPGTTVVDGGTLGLGPGSVIGVAAGEHRIIRFRNLHGSAAAPIIIRNHQGLVTIDNDDEIAAVVLARCSHVRLTGSGHPDHQHGFRLRAQRQDYSTIYVVNRSTAIELDHLEIFGAGFAGISAKDEPTEDGSRNRGNYLMEDIHIHHNHIHHTGSEGMYIGHTFYNGWDNRGTSDELLYPHLISGLRIHDNDIHDTGSEGIQVGSVRDGLEVARNRIVRFGQDPFGAYQDNGMQIGYSPGVIRDNFIAHGPGVGLVVQTQGDNLIAGNIIVDTGEYGILCADRQPTPESLAAGGIDMGPGFVVCNNTVITSGQLTDPGARHAIRFNSRLITDTNHAIDNLLVVAHGEALATGRRDDPLVQAGNLDFVDRATAGLDHRFHLLPDSPAIDAGAAWPIDWPISTDHYGRPRLHGSAIDVGAEEWHPRSRRIRIRSDLPSQWRIEPPAAHDDSDEGWTVFSGCSPELDHLLEASLLGPG